MVGGSPGAAQIDRRHRRLPSWGEDGGPDATVRRRYPPRVLSAANALIVGQSFPSGPR